MKALFLGAGTVALVALAAVIKWMAADWLVRGVTALVSAALLGAFVFVAVRWTDGDDDSRPFAGPGEAPTIVPGRDTERPERPVLPQAAVSTARPHTQPFTGTERKAGPAEDYTDSGAGAVSGPGKRHGVAAEPITRKRGPAEETPAPDPAPVAEAVGESGSGEEPAPLFPDNTGWQDFTALRELLAAEVRPS